MEVHFILTVLLVVATVEICKPDTAPLTAPADLQTAATGWSSGGGCSSGSCGGGGWGESSGGCSSCGGGGGWRRPRPSCGGGCGGGCGTQQYNIKVKVTKHKRDLRNRQIKPTGPGKPLLSSSV